MLVLGPAARLLPGGRLTAPAAVVAKGLSKSYRKWGRAGAVGTLRAEFGSDLVPDVEVDLRVDDHPWPVRELAHLLELHRLYTERTDPSTWLPLTAELAVEVDAHLHLLGHAPLPQGLTTWGGMENFEYRLHEGWIEPEILDQLRAAAARARG